MKLRARSCDINVIENCFSHLSKEYNKLFDKLKKNYPSKNKADTFNLIKKAWDNVSNKLIIKRYSKFGNVLLKV